MWAAQKAFCSLLTQTASLFQYSSTPKVNKVKKSLISICPRLSNLNRQQKRLLKFCVSFCSAADSVSELRECNFHGLTLSKNGLIAVGKVQLQYDNILVNECNTSRMLKQRCLLLTGEFSTLSAN